MAGTGADRTRNPGSPDLRLVSRYSLSMMRDMGGELTVGRTAANRGQGWRARRMKKVYGFATAMLAISILLATNARAQRPSPDVAITNPREYEVTIATTFLVLGNGRPPSVLRRLGDCAPTRVHGTAWTGRWVHRGSLLSRKAAASCTSRTTNPSMCSGNSARESLREGARARESFPGPLGGSQLRSPAVGREVVGLWSE